MKKKLCVTLLAVTMAFALSGCGASSKYAGAASDTAAPAEQNTMDMSEAAEEPAAEFDVTEEAVEEEAWDDMDDTAEEPDSGMTDAAGEAKAAQSNEKVIYTYNYSVETKQFDTFMQAVQERIDEYGGYLESSETNGNPEMNIRRYANMVIRIPADKMHSFLNMVKENSNVTYSSSSTDNVTLSYVDMQSHIKALKTEQETLMNLLERAEKLEDIVTLQSQLTEVRYELESYESQLRVYDNRINYSTLYLDITEVERETSVATELTYGEEIRQGLSDTFYGIGQGLRDFSIWFIVNLPFILIWAAVIALIVLIVRKILRVQAKRKEQRQAARQKDRKEREKSGMWTGQGAAADEAKASEENPESK